MRGEGSIAWRGCSSCGGSSARRRRDGLRGAAVVTDLVAYRTAADAPVTAARRSSAAANRRRHLRRPSAVRRFATLIGEEQAADLLQHDRGGDDWSRHRGAARNWRDLDHHG